MRFATAGGDAVELEKRPRLTKAEARRAMIMKMLVLKSKGYSNAEIGLMYRLDRVTGLARQHVPSPSPSGNE